MFEFDEENLKRAHEIIARYPPQYKKGAVMPILDLGQRQNNGWTSISVMNAVAKLLEMPKMRVYEVRRGGSIVRLALTPGRYILHDVQPRTGRAQLLAAVHDDAMPAGWMRIDQDPQHDPGPPEHQAGTDDQGREVHVDRGGVPGSVQQCPE